MLPFTSQDGIISFFRLFDPNVSRAVISERKGRGKGNGIVLGL